MNPTLTDQVRQKYAWTAREVIQKEFSQLTVLGACCGGSDGDACCSSAGADHVHGAMPEPVEAFGASLYPASETGALPSLAVSASCGCGNPTAVASLEPGQVVLDLGSGSGVDAFLAARRVGREGRVVGVDLTPEMVALANSAKRSARLDNVEFASGQMEDLPLPDESVDVVISNCAINLADDKQAVFAEIARVLRPRGSIGICDVVASDALSPEDRAARGSYVDCIAGALSVGEFSEGLRRAGFGDVKIDLTHAVADEMFAAAITGRKVRAS
jgi:arsenite methyltransferase